MRPANHLTRKGLALCHKKFGGICSKYNNKQSGENGPDFSKLFPASLSAEVFCHCFVCTGEVRCLNLDIDILNLPSGFLSRKGVISIVVTGELKLRRRC
jgi:hypothetical protein